MAKASTAKKPPTPQIGAEVTYIPFHQLANSPLNVRQDSGDITALAQNIQSVGRLLHNLVVYPEGDQYLVIDGGRRLKALAALVAGGFITEKSPWPCQIVTADEAVALSLSANTQRQAMHPVDEALAFHELIIRQKMKPAAVALMYGASKRYVAQRLKLAAVHPDILAACREGKINLETLQAFTVVADRGRQFDVFVDQGGKDMGPDDEMDPDDVRDALLGEAMEDDHRLVKYIGLDAYREAGGEFLTDLFSDDDQPTLLADDKLVRKLADKKLKAAAKKITGWAWVTTTTEHSVNVNEFESVSPVGDEFTAEELTHVGAVVMVGYDGKEKTLTGWIRRKDSDAFEELQNAIDKANKSDAGQSANDQDNEPTGPKKPLPAETDAVRAARWAAKVAGYRARMAYMNAQLKGALAMLPTVTRAEDRVIRDALVAAIETLDEVANEE